jgi:hypothetical protein
VQEYGAGDSIASIKILLFEILVSVLPNEYMKALCRNALEVVQCGQPNRQFNGFHRVDLLTQKGKQT